MVDITKNFISYYLIMIITNISNLNIDMIEYKQKIMYELKKNVFEIKIIKINK